MKVVDLYLAPEDLYRLGNATDPRLTHIRRPKDIDTVEINGLLVVVANGKGISLATQERISKSPVSGWVWKISKGTQMPQGLRLINDREGHYWFAMYQICPLMNLEGCCQNWHSNAKKYLKSR